MCQFRGSENPEILFHVSILFSTMWRTFLFNLFMRLFIKHLSQTNGRQFRLFEKNSNDFTNEWKSRFPNAHFYEEIHQKLTMSVLIGRLTRAKARDRNWPGVAARRELEDAAILVQKRLYG